MAAVFWSLQIQGEEEEEEEEEELPSEEEVAEGVHRAREELAFV